MPSISEFWKMSWEDLERYSEVGPDASARETAARMLDRRIAKQISCASRDTAIYTRDLARYTKAIGGGTIALFIVTGLSLMVQLILAFIRK
jgi:hypothetical protein